MVNGFKRFMPLKTHRLKLQVFEDSFKRDEGQKWLVEFIAQTGLLKPISMEKAGTLIDKFVQLGIIEEVIKHIFFHELSFCLVEKTNISFALKATLISRFFPTG